MHGAIRELWKNLGAEKSFLGYPITDELIAEDGAGRFSHFQGGSIYWTPKTGAHEVHGAIRELWKNLGGERSSLGYPVTDELPLRDGGKFSRFQGGEIHWYPQRGAFVAAFSPFSTLTLRCVSLHCIDETNPEVGGNDEIAIAGTIIEINSTNTGEKGYKFGKIDLDREEGWDDETWSEWGSPHHLISIPINLDNEWPKSFLATCILVEVDNGWYTDYLDNLLEKLIPVVKQKVNEKMQELGIAVGTYLGSAALGMIVGSIAAKITAYILDKLFEWMKSWWGDDLFVPVPFSITIPDPHALFGSGTLDSQDSHYRIQGHGGEYEFWLDWTLS